MQAYEAYRRRVLCIALGVLVLAFVQAACAWLLTAPDLLKDAHAFGYDIALYAVAALRIGSGARIDRIATVLVGILLAGSGFDGLSDLWTSLGRVEDDSMAQVLLSDAFALAAPCFAAILLLRFRREADPLVRASWLNARADLIAAALSIISDLVGNAMSLPWLGYAFDLIGVILSFQAAGIVLRSAHFGGATTRSHLLSKSFQ